MRSWTLFLTFAVSALGSRDGTLNTGPLDPLPRKNTPAENYFQPAMDFDKDSCYNAVAVDASGRTDKGLPLPGTATSGCRDESRLNHQNVYVRSRCNKGWCAHYYAYYFEKDIGPFAGHRYDWEHVVVWTKYNGNRDKNGYPLIVYVSASQHKGYETKHTSNVRYQEENGYHAKMVYHLDSVTTHNIRFASNNDEPPENHWKAWIKANLVGWLGFPSDNVKNSIQGNVFGDAYLCLKDSAFGGCLTNAMPDEVKKSGFDVTQDFACSSLMATYGTCVKV
ncbi:necrosis inducing [Microdochium trichocladiopsis]|uniref:Necrosis inducing n=1 Tax=Microdochium trichocladiopsis TaxID=1682393 RepID=A0A9P8Y097_9PEZI|nr:necrosis inducing [Microdochium trichocladiopsis]KAH7024457.1 necrosis inducing [Microdochium trichocladiopsis]